MKNKCGHTTWQSWARVQHDGFFHSVTKASDNYTSESLVTGKYTHILPHAIISYATTHSIYLDSQ